MFKFWKREAASQHDLRGSLALVTGASRGLGASFARDLASRGCNLILVARRAALLEEVSEQLQRQHNVQVHLIDMDLAQAGSADALHEVVRSRGLRPDILINNAGRSQFRDLTDMPQDVHDQLTTLNMTTPTQLSRLFARDMQARGTGRILLVSSIAGFQGGPGFAAYAASKAYITTLGEAFSFELRHSGVTCTTLAAGMIRTEALSICRSCLTPYKRMFMMSSADVARSGIDAMLAGRHVVIPGAANKATHVTGLIMPRKLRVRLAHSFMVTGKWFTTRWGMRHAAKLRADEKAAQVGKTASA